MPYLFAIAALGAAIIIIFKFWLKWVIAWDRSPTCLVGKTVMVTGANRGVGYYTALDFARRGARVILACRDQERAEEAREKIIVATGNQNVVVKIVDFASLASVRKLAEDVNANVEKLDILVNNAAAMGYDGDCLSGDGLSLFMQTNYFGPFLLTVLLAGLLKKSAPSRIVNVTSIVARSAQLDPNDMNAFRAQYTTYSNSKLCLILFTKELARKLKSSGVEVNSVHPGFVYTDILRNLPARLQTVVKAVASAFFRTAEEGAQSVIYVAVSKEVEGVSGEYFDNCGIAWLPSIPSAGRDEDLAKKIWRKSEEFVKLSAKERTL